MNHSIYKRDNIITIMSNRFHECLEIEIPTFNLKYTNEKKVMVRNYWIVMVL